MFKGIKLLMAATLAGATLGCSSDPDYHSASDLIKPTAQSGDVPKRVSLDQGWDDETKDKFWFTSQGARILPYTWFIWLEQPGSENLFRNSDHMEMLRYLPIETSERNPAGLPIGFVAAHDDDTNQAWMGMTCAACHTNQVDYKGTKLLIDGAPTLANFVLFYDRLVAALSETNQDQEKFDRFAKNVLGDKYNEENSDSLRQSLEGVAIAAAERQQVNSLPESYPQDFTSYARLDAFGNIQNAGTAFALHDLSNRNTPDGPVSYPFLWGSHQSDVVQWNASAPNTPVVGPLARNVGEVIGVFGNLSMEPAPWWKKLFGLKVSYSANVDINGLGHLESYVKVLRSPQWPEQYLPAIDATKAAAGAQLFAGECAQCHQVVPRQDEGKKYVSNKTPVHVLGTDPVTAWNADRRCAKTLILEGTKKAILAGEKFGAESAAISIPVNGAVGLILDHPVESLEAGLRPIRTHSSEKSSEMEAGSSNSQKSLEELVSDHVQERRKIASSSPSTEATSCGDPDSELVYKGRPLNGIWATAPYLHNGSVPNLWEMLQSGDKRVTSFWVGNREFDPVKVGYLYDSGLNEFKVLNSSGEIQPGNSNRGHEFGTTWTDEQKWAVIEYMKTL